MPSPQEFQIEWPPSHEHVYRVPVEGKPGVVRCEVEGCRMVAADLAWFRERKAKRAREAARR